MKCTWKKIIHYLLTESEKHISYACGRKSSHHCMTIPTKTMGKVFDNWSVLSKVAKRREFLVIIMIMSWKGIGTLIDIKSWPPVPARIGIRIQLRFSNPIGQKKYLSSLFYCPFVNFYLLKWLMAMFYQLCFQNELGVTHTFKSYPKFCENYALVQVQHGYLCIQLIEALSSSPASVLWGSIVSLPSI